MARNLLLSLLFFLSLTFPAAGAELRLKTLNTAQLRQIYDLYDYHGEKDYLMIPSYKYPAILLSHFPDDFGKITDEKERNALFIKILAPLALKINQEIKLERDELLALNTKFEAGQKLSKKEQKVLEAMAARYDVFTRLKGEERQRFLLRELLLKIDFIPPSLLITAAAIETNWGTSRIVKEGNSLYKTLVWHTDKGLKPVGETEDDTYRIKTYPDIYSSMKEFALSINSELKFADMRDVRKEFLYRENIPFGNILAPYLIWKSPLKNYAGMFQYTLAYYELNIIDKSALDSTINVDKLPKALKRLAM